jgi:hypothetical protein
MPIDRAELDLLQQAYKAAVDEWVAAIRLEEGLATPDHSIRAWDRWDQAGFKEQEAEDRAKAAKKAYQDGLRMLDYDI